MVSIFLSNINNSILYESLACSQLDGYKYSYLRLKILLLKYSYLVQMICTQRYGFKYLIRIILSKWLNSSIWLINRTILDLSEPGSNSNEGVFHILRSSRAGASLTDAVSCYTQDTQEYNFFFNNLQRAVKFRSFIHVKEKQIEFCYPWHVEITMSEKQ